jgi:hypothetical protein
MKEQIRSAFCGQVDSVVSRIVVAAYGGGTNSTAMLIECARRHERVDLIMFADTGGERPHTYEYVHRFSDWLVANEMPPITWVRHNGMDESLEHNCLRIKSLPSLAYGYKKCSLKFKIQPQEKYCNNWAPAKDEWKAGRKIVKLIGFDADEAHRAEKGEVIEDKYQRRYPLIEWDMGRDECISVIDEAGLCQPGKSSCFFCPATKPHEIRQLLAVYPDLAERALVIENNAKLISMKGLGRSFAWRDLLAQAELFDDGYATTPELSCDCYDG